MGIQDNAVSGALQGERLWITCAYFVCDPWVFAVGLVLAGLHFFSAFPCPVADFFGREPYHKNRPGRGPATGGLAWLAGARVGRSIRGQCCLLVNGG